MKEIVTLQDMREHYYDCNSFNKVKRMNTCLDFILDYFKNEIEPFSFNSLYDVQEFVFQQICKENQSSFKLIMLERILIFINGHKECDRICSIRGVCFELEVMFATLIDYVVNSEYSECEVILIKDLSIMLKYLTRKQLLLWGNGCDERT